MKTNAYLVLLSFILVSLLGSCTLQKKRYSSGYHVNWHHQKKKTLARIHPKPSDKLTGSIKIQNPIISPKETLLAGAFKTKYPPSLFLQKKISLKKIPAIKKNMALQTAANNIKADTLTTLTPQEISENYFIDRNGKKQRNRKGLRTTLIIVGAVFSFGLVGIPILILGLALPHPTTDSKELTEKQLKNIQTRKTIIKTVTIIAILILVVVIAFLIAFLIEGPIVGF
ncbi:MAG: fumarate reductase subunit D [Salibacteraceae bacterium]|jgi:fumarate reductase subunit D